MRKPLFPGVGHEKAKQSVVGFGNIEVVQLDDGLSEKIFEEHRIRSVVVDQKSLVGIFPVFPDRTGDTIYFIDVFERGFSDMHLVRKAIMMRESPEMQVFLC